MPAEIAPRPAPTLSTSPSPSHKLSPSQRSAAAAAGDFLTNTLGAASCELTPRLIQSPVTNLLSPPSRTHTASHKPQEFQVLWSSRCCCPGWENGFMSFRIFPSCLSDPRLGTDQRAGGCTVQAAEVSLNVIKKYVTVQSPVCCRAPSPPLSPNTSQHSNWFPFNAQLTNISPGPGTGWLRAQPSTVRCSAVFKVFKPVVLDQNVPLL